jgi:hypothetical protein
MEAPVKQGRLVKLATVATGGIPDTGDILEKQASMAVSLGRGVPAALAVVAAQGASTILPPLPAAPEVMAALAVMAISGQAGMVARVEPEKMATLGPPATPELREPLGRAVTTTAAASPSPVEAVEAAVVAVAPVVAVAVEPAAAVVEAVVAAAAQRAFPAAMVAEIGRLTMAAVADWAVPGASVAVGVPAAVPWSFSSRAA